MVVAVAVERLRVLQLLAREEVVAVARDRQDLERLYVVLLIRAVAAAADLLTRRVLMEGRALSSLVMLVLSNILVEQFLLLVATLSTHLRNLAFWLPLLIANTLSLPGAAEAVRNKRVAAVAVVS